jgi:tetratricopeptide (TPR) repeat protein
MSNKTLQVNLALNKAKTLARNGATVQAAQIYRAVLKKFPGNKRALEGLKTLERSRPTQERLVLNTGPTQEQINDLIGLYERGQLQAALKQGTALAGQYPNAPMIQYILGVVNAVAGRKEEAVTGLTKALRIKPDYADAHNSLGNVLSELGKHEQAIASYTKALQIKPDYADAHNNLGNVLGVLGKPEQAIASYTRALQLMPDYADAYYNLANALSDLGRHKEAIPSYSRALQLMPDFAEAHNNLANAFSELGDYEQAVASYTKALQIRPDHAKAHNNLANAFSERGKHEQAIASYARAIMIEPDYAEAHCNLGAALSDLGRHEQAIASYTEALRIKPDYAKAHENLGRIKKYEPGDPQIAQMRDTISDRKISENEEMLLRFALGKAYDDIGDTENSFPHFLEGNRLRKKELGYDISSDKRLFSLIKSIFSEDEIPALEETRPETGYKKRPVFIVGMHRSGTTLAEQILASHSQVFGADETRIMNSIIASSIINTDNIKIGEFNLDTIKYIRTCYLTEMDSFQCSEQYLTDKMPLNFRWVGFILTAMPEAKIINLQRDPAATCWSVFKQYFSGNEIEYAYDLTDISEYYNLYRDLMNFWREKFPNQIYDLNYEALTENQEEETRKLLEYCGLDWEDQCLEFHKTNRAVRTRSSAQVRQVMYKGSSEAWRKYEAHLQPMLQALER